MDYKYCSFLVCKRVHSALRFVEITEAKFKCHLSVGTARPVPRAVNKHYFARGGPINVPFMYIY